MMMEIKLMVMDAHYAKLTQGIYVMEIILMFVHLNVEMVLLKSVNHVMMEIYFNMMDVSNV